MLFRSISVFICGETGTGKEVVARELHRLGARAAGPFVTVNCGAISPQLIESELFGHVRGAFTGADRDRKGLLEEANQGTIFLDEITETLPVFQVKLLRALQEYPSGRSSQAAGAYVPILCRATGPRSQQ